MRTLLSKLAIGLVLLTVLCLAACGGGPAGEPADKLAEIMDRGILLVSTDPAYPPQSELVEGATRPADTKCTAEQRTANEMAGFDIDVAAEIAKRLGVELCFVTPDWTLITAGGWADRWDVSVGSMTILPERMEVLYFSQPYYATPAAFFVHQDNTTFTQASDVSGAKVGGCSGCTYEYYLDHTLSIPGVTLEFVVDNVEFVGYDTDSSALADLALGDGVRLDAVLTAVPTGLEQITNGLPLKQLGDPVFFEYLAAAVDKSHGTDPIPLIEKVTEIIRAMHADGTLASLASKYYNYDATSGAAEFDVDALGQY